MANGVVRVQFVPADAAHVGARAKHELFLDHLAEGHKQPVHVFGVV